MEKQGAVEWFIDNYDVKSIKKYREVVERAYKIEKEQIKAAYNAGYLDGEMDSKNPSNGDVAKFDDAENYYNETLGK